MKKRTFLRPREADFITNLSKGMSQGAAYKQAGYNCTKESASASASRLLKRLKSIFPKEIVLATVPANTIVEQISGVLKAGRNKDKVSAAKLLDCG